MKIALLLVISIGCLGLFSCQRAYYAPNAHNVPLFQRGGEVRLMASTSDEGQKTFDLQAAVSPVRYVGIMGSYFETSYNQSGNGHYYDYAVGGYFPSKNIVLELYFGKGFGYAHNNFNLGRYIKNDFVKYFIQPNIGFTTRYLDLAYSARIARLELTNIRWWNHEDPSSMYYTSEIPSELQKLSSNNPVLLYESAVTLRVGWKYGKIQMQFAGTAFRGERKFDIIESNASIGILVALAGKNKPAWQPFKFRNIFKL